MDLVKLALPSKDQMRQEKHALMPSVPQHRLGLKVETVRNAALILDQMMLKLNASQTTATILSS
jgi:hypothetical protein